MILPRPNVIVEGAFQSTEIGDPLWSNLTDYVDFSAADLNISQRRQTLFDEPSPGILSFAVDNSSGNFTDTNASSPFYPGITQNTPLRARVQWPTTANLLSGPISRTDDENYWTSEQGDLDIDTTSPAGGVSSSITWDTGILDQTDVRVMIDNGPQTMPGTTPVYVKAGEAYSASISMKLPTGTLSCSLRLTWYDMAGDILSEDTSSIVALSSSWQTLSITNAVAPADGKVRLSIANETTVLPSDRTILYVGGDSDPDQWSNQGNLRIPDSAEGGDIAFLWRRAANNSVTFALPAGWTYYNSWSDTSGKSRLDYRILGPHESGNNLTAYQDVYTRLLSLLIIYRNVNQSSPIHQMSTSTDTTYHAARTCASVTTTINNCMIVSAAFDCATTTSEWTPPGTLTQREVQYCRRGWAPSGSVADIILATAGASGARIFTSNVASKSAIRSTMALAPAAGTGPDNVTVYIGAPMLVKASSLPSFVEGGNWESLITAYADSWEDTWQIDKPVVSVSATDRSKLLQEIDVFSPLRQTIRDSDPIIYYRLYEQDGATEGSDHSVYNQPSLEVIPASITVLTYYWRQGKPPPRGSPGIHLVQTDVTHGNYLQAENLNTAVGNGPAVSVFTFFSSTWSGAAYVTLLKIAPTSGSKVGRSLVEIYAEPSGNVGIKCRILSDTTEVYPLAQTALNIFDGEVHCIGGTAEITNGSLVVTLYVDGENYGSTSVATTFTEIPALTAVCVGGAYKYPGRLCDGIYHNVAAFNSVLSDEDFADIWTAHETGYADDTCTDRIGRMLDWSDISGMNIDNSDVLCGGLPSDNATTLLEGLQIISATDGGTVFVNGDDNITFISAKTKQAQYAPLLTLSAADLAEPPSATKNDELLVNDVTINRLSDGTSQRLENAASILQYGRHAKSVDTFLKTNSDARDMASYYITFFREPITRFGSVSIECLLQADWADLIIANMWDIIRITDLPSTAPATSLDSFIEGREWNINADSWRLTFDVSYAIPFFIIGDATRAVCGAGMVSK